jgi:hypothetical protein
VASFFLQLVLTDFSEAMLATLYLVIAMLFRFTTSSVPNALDVTLPPLIEEPSDPEYPSNPEETLFSGTQRIAIICM